MVAKKKVYSGQERAVRMINFIEKYIVVPEGVLVGQPMKLLPEQKDFIHAVYGNVDKTDGSLITRRGILSIARKNGKSGLISSLLAGHIIGPEAKANGQLYSAARSRDQAAVVFNYLAKSLRLRNDLEGLVQITDSYKVVKGLAMGTNYRALSADATTAHGLSPVLTIHDELGQVVGPQDALYDALETAGGAHAEPLSLIISTQAASDADLLSTLIDDAIRSPTPETVCRLYAAAKEDDIYDERVWKKVNFALGIFRMEKEFREAAQRASRLPAFEATFRNLYLNQRVSLLNLLVSPGTWQMNGMTVDDGLFRSGAEVHIGLDLSSTRDLTAAIGSVKDPDTGIVHTKAWVYTPLFGLEERAKADRAPYLDWVKAGYMIALPARTVTYDLVAKHLQTETEGMNVVACHFDRWRMEMFKKAAEDIGLWANEDETQWLPVGQGFRDMTPRIEFFEHLVENSMLAHGNNPVLNMAAANAIAVRDPANNRKLEKAKSSARIDPLQALIMSVYGHGEGLEFEEPETEISENSMFFV